MENEKKLSHRNISIYIQDENFWLVDHRLFGVYCFNENVPPRFTTTRNNLYEVFIIGIHSKTFIVPTCALTCPLTSDITVTVTQYALAVERASTER